MSERLRESLATFSQRLVTAPSSVTDFRRAEDLLDDGQDLRRPIDREDAVGSHLDQCLGAVVWALEGDDEWNVEVRQQRLDGLTTRECRRRPFRAHEVPRFLAGALRYVSTSDASPGRIVPTTTERLQQKRRVGFRSVNDQQTQRYGHAESAPLAIDTPEVSSRVTVRPETSRVFWRDVFSCIVVTPFNWPSCLAHTPLPLLTIELPGA
jgi:hypothetical protein